MSIYSRIKNTFLLRRLPLPFALSPLAHFCNPLLVLGFPIKSYGLKGGNGKSAYELAVENGYTGTETEWLASLVGTDGKDGVDGKDGEKGETGVGVASAVIKTVEGDGVYGMHLILTMTDGTEIDSGIVGYTAKHTVTYFAATDATCTEDGNLEYWYCSDCGKYFLDET